MGLTCSHEPFKSQSRGQRQQKRDVQSLRGLWEQGLWAPVKELWGASTSCLSLQHTNASRKTGSLSLTANKPTFCQLPGELKRSSQAPERNAAQLTVISFVWLWANPHPDAWPKETKITNLYYFNCSICGC